MWSLLVKQFYSSLSLCKLFCLLCLFYNIIFVFLGLYNNQPQTSPSRIPQVQWILRSKKGIFFENNDICIFLQEKTRIEACNAMSFKKSRDKFSHFRPHILNQNVPANNLAEFRGLFTYSRYTTIYNIPYLSVWLRLYPNKVSVFLQDDCHCCVFWPRWAGVSGKVPLCGLRRKHHLFTSTHECHTVMPLPSAWPTNPNVPRVLFKNDLSWVFWKSEDKTSTVGWQRQERSARFSQRVEAFLPHHYCCCFFPAVCWRFCLHRQKHFSIFWEKGWWQLQKTQRWAANTQNTFTLLRYFTLLFFLWF